jgi:hypothetical protein
MRVPTRRRQQCETVERELRDMYRIRVAFGDAALLKQAQEHQ